MTGTGIIHSNNLQICPGGFQSGRVTGTNTLSINNYLSPTPPPPDKPFDVGVFNYSTHRGRLPARSRGVCGERQGRGVCARPLAPGPGALRAQTALRGRAGRDPACPARFPAALPEDAGGEPAVTGRRLRRVLCDRSSAGSRCGPADRSAAVPPPGELFWGVVPAARRGGAGARPPGKAFVLPQREQGNQTETFEGSELWCQALELSR